MAQSRGRGFMMDRVTVNLANCYGIKKLQHTFDFSQKSAYAIYAPNGVMKSSLAETFKNAADGENSKDRIFPSRTSSRKIHDESGAEIEGERVLVVLPYDSEFGPTEKTSTLLINAELRREYEQLHASVEEAQAALIAALRKQAGTGARRDFAREVSSAITRSPDKFEDAVTRIRREIEREKDPIFADVKYDIIFNDTVEKALEGRDLRGAVDDYIRVYNDLLSKSTYFRKGVFDYYNAGQIAKSLSDNGFFTAEHTVNLKGNGGITEISTQKELEKIIADEKAKILSDATLRKKFDDVAKQLDRNTALRDFCRYLQDNEPLLAQLNNVEQFKEDVIKSYIKANEVLYNELITKIDAVENRTREIEAEAQRQRGEWDQVITTFNDRFFVPFELKVVNRVAVALGDEKIPVLGFTYTDGREHVDVEKPTLMQALSTGERKALYVLNVIFEVRRREQANQETLVVVDDIADSFDYQNKYAILQFLKDISEDGLCKLIIMTHNFDFFRTLQSRFVGFGHCLMASKRDDGITLVPAEGIQNVFVHVWKPRFFTNARMKIASIPFLRNLIEFTKGDADPNFLRLTSLLHWKGDTPSITVGELDAIYNALCAPSGASATPGKLVVDLVEEEADACLAETGTLNLENKIVLAIASRLRAERYMLNKINDPAFATAITGSQTGRLVGKFKSVFPNEANARSILDRVALMTPENIHLNSFMYEPLVDMSDEHLKRLYSDVKVLP